MSKAGDCKFWKKYEETGSIMRKQGNGQMSKLMNENKILIEEEIKNKVETSLHYFHD